MEKVFVDKSISYKSWQDKQKNDTIKQKHKIINGEKVTGKWNRRPEQFKYEIDDIVNYQGFYGLPRLVYDKKEFLKLVNDDHFIGKRIYTAKTQEELNQYANDLRYGKWYIDCSIGGAQFGQGMYCSSNYTKGSRINEVDSIMSYYKNEYSRKNKTLYKIETLTLDKSAKIFIIPRHKAFSSLNSFIDIAKEYVKQNPELFGLRKDFFKDINHLSNVELDLCTEAWNKIGTEIFHNKRSATSLLVELGYDAVRVERRSDDMPHTIILNRTKLILFNGDLDGKKNDNYFAQYIRS